MKEKLATIDLKCRSLVDANYSTVKSNHLNGCLHFEAKSESFLTVDIIPSTLASSCFSTVETKENFSILEHTTKLSFTQTLTVNMLQNGFVLLKGD